MELDGYSLICISYAQASLAKETFLIELCTHIPAESFYVAEELLTHPRTIALENFQHIVPFFKRKISNQTTNSTRATILTLQYTSACGAIFNDFLMDWNVKISREKIGWYKSHMKEDYIILQCLVCGSWNIQNFIPLQFW